MPENALTPLARELLACLPKEPMAWPLPELAVDLLGKADSKALSAMQKALREVRELLYIQSQNTRPFGYRDHYGIRADRWAEAQNLLAAEGVD